MNLHKLFPFDKPSELLVCATDGFSLSAAVVTREEGEIKLLHKADVDQVDMAEALEECVTQLKQDGWQGNGKAILLSPAVLSTLVELPVSPKKPRPLQQMMALVRGEVEVLLMQYMTRWSVGHLMVGRGYLTEIQAQAVMDLQQGKPNPAGGLELLDKFSFKRFGELAEELGYIKPGQLTACLTCQEWLKADDEQIECNWVAQGAVDDIPGTFNWLVSCVNQSLLQRWVSVFSKQGLTLTALYPFTGCSTVLLPDNAEEKIILESHPGVAVSIKEEAGNIRHQHVYLNLNKSALARCLESYHALPFSHHASVYLSSRQSETEELKDELQQSLDLEIQTLTHPAVTEQFTLGMLGAARHAFDLGKKGVCIAVLKSGPVPPLLQRLEIRMAILTAVLLILILASELSLFIRHSSAEMDYEQLHSRWTAIDKARRGITLQTNAVKKLENELNKQRAEQIRLKAMIDFYNHSIPARAALVEGVLGALQSTVNDEVIIISLNENPKQQSVIKPSLKTGADKMQEQESFAIEAWALSEPAAQSFIQNMQRAMAPLGLVVKDTPVLSASGPLNLNGFNIKMRLVKQVALAPLALQIVNR